MPTRNRAPQGSPIQHAGLASSLMLKSEDWRVQSMFRKGFSRLVTLLPDLKIGLSVAPALLPLNSAMAQSRRDQGSWAAEDALKPTVREVCSADAASISLRADENNSHEWGRRRSVDRPQDWPRQQRGLQCTFPIFGVQRAQGAAQQVRSRKSGAGFHPRWVSCCYPRKNSAPSLWTRVPPGSDSSPRVWEKLPPQCPGAQGRRDPAFPLQNSLGRPSAALFQRRFLRQAMETGADPKAWGQKGSMPCRSSSEAAFRCLQGCCSPGEAGSPAPPAPLLGRSCPLTGTWNRRLSC